MVARMPPAITDIGSRVELVSLDPHFHDISIALYEQRPPATGYVIHSYSSYEGALERVEYAAEAMRILGGMISTEGDPRGLRFACGSNHLLGSKRIFIEAVKILPRSPLEQRPLAILDKKSGLTIAVASEGDGAYRVTANRGEDGGEETTDGGERRVAIAAGGLARLGQMTPLEGSANRVGFECGHSHDALVGLLLTRAMNVRAVIRELENAAARGVLAAPKGM